ncbi:MAG: hypothetical protein ABJA87_12275 [bacterium]
MAVVLFLALMILPTAVVYALMHLSHVFDFAERVFERIHPPAPQPVGPPIERIAADLRRISAHLDALVDAGPVPGRILRVRATTTAYDDVLLRACRALEVEPATTDTPMSSQDRLQTEAALAAAGLSW